MKKNILRLMLRTCSMSILLLVFVLQSCGTKQKAINQLRDLSYEIQTNGINYDVDDWKRTAYEYLKINKRIAKYRYTAAESEEIGELNGQCLGYFATSVASNVVGRVTNTVSGIEGLIKGIKSAIGK